MAILTSLYFSLSVEDKDLGTRMTGTYQVLDGDKGPEYGTPFSPTSPKAGDATETNDLGNASPRSRSPECLPSENGLNENEHVPAEKEPNSSMFLLLTVKAFHVKKCETKLVVIQETMNFNN